MTKMLNLIGQNKLSEVTDYLLCEIIKLRKAGADFAVMATDIKNLQHQHITVVRNEHTYLRMNLPESKKHDKPIVTIQSAVPVYEQRKKYHALNGRAEPTDYLFFPELKDRTDVLMLLGWQFMFVQNLAKIEANAANGRRRTL